MNDRLFFLRFPEWVNWRLSLKAPNEVPLKALPGWSLVTPIGIARMGKDPQHCISRVLIRLPDDILLIDTKYMALRTSADYQEVMNAGRVVLAQLRYAACQATLPKRLTDFFEDTVSPYDCDPSQFLTPLENHLFKRAYKVPAAIGEDTLDYVSKLDPEFTTPVHVDVILDAIEAYVANDFRRALLYAAIAVETFALEKLENGYNNVLDKKTAEHCVVEIPDVQDKLVTKDPVYKVLKQGDQFSRLLHELPLYLWKKTLLLEDQELYRRAIQLRKTRNKIAHQGVSPGDEKHFTEDEAGARAGLETAIKVLRWFGDDRAYEITNEIVSLHADGEIE